MKYVVINTRDCTLTSLNQKLYMQRTLIGSWYDVEFFFFTPEGAFFFLADAVAAGIFYSSCLSICQSHSEEKDISQIG